MENPQRHGGTHSRFSLLTTALIVAFYPSSAFAYIDPGSGSLLLQIVMSAIFGGIFLARNFLAKTAAWLRRIFSGGKAERVEKPLPPDNPVS